MATATALPKPQEWKHVPGRPTGLTPALADGIRSLVLAGASTRRAAAALGVPSTTFERWRDRARRGRKPYAGYFDAFETAETVFLAGVEQTLAVAGREDWRAAAWLLSRRLAREYGDTRQTEAGAAKDGGTIANERWAALIERHGGDPTTANFDDDMRMLIRAKQAAADKAEFNRLPPAEQKAMLFAELERRGLPTNIYDD